jgi:agmatine deiminase
MPAEWEPHAATVMIWPSRADLWVDRLDAACAEYAAVANSIAAFEPVLMVCRPGDESAIVRACSANVEALPFGADDSWARDCGPIFVVGDHGELAAVKFGFNAWGNRFHPYDQDALVPDRLAAHLGVPVYAAPMILEGGSFFVDGEGTLITTEQCLLNPNRNPHLDKEQIEAILADYLGATTVIWLPYGHSLDTGPVGTDGHVDGVAQYVAPGRVMIEFPQSSESTEYERARANLAVLEATRDASGRVLEVDLLDPPLNSEISYANHYLVNGAVIVPVEAGGGSEPALTHLKEIYPDREIVALAAETIAYGGGGPHCITQQVPAV